MQVSKVTIRKMAQVSPCYISIKKSKTFTGGEKPHKKNSVPFWHTPILAPKATSPAARELTQSVIHSLVQVEAAAMAVPAGSHGVAARMECQFCPWRRHSTVTERASCFCF